MANRWRNRIVGVGTEAPDQLLANPLNWRTHPASQEDALVGVLDEVGWVQDIIVNRVTGHVVDGHLRVRAALKHGEAAVPVVYVELTEGEERLILATLDPLSALAGSDEKLLDDLLATVTSPNGAIQQMLDDLLATAGDEAGEGGSGEGATGPTDTSGLLALGDVTIPEPTHETAVGDCWQVGEHVLWVIPVMTGWSQWGKTLDELGPDALFVPYPGPMVTMTERGRAYPLVLVQPDPYIAAHLLDRHVEVFGADDVERLRHAGSADS